MNSTSLTNGFINEFRKGNHLTAEVKNSVFNRLNEINRFGGDIEERLFFLNQMPHREDLGSAERYWFISVANREHLDLQYRNGFFEILFYGNKNYAGKEVDFGDFRLNFLRYQQFQIGFMKTVDKGIKKRSTSMALSLIKGEENESIEVKEAGFFTEQDGEYIDFAFNAVYQHTDTNNKGLSAFNGPGMSIDYMYKLEDEKSTFLFQLKDLGFITWNDKSYVMERDTTYRFDGWEVDNIFDLQDSLLLRGLSVDSVNNELSGGGSKEAYHTVLPALVHLAIMQRFNTRLSVLAGVKYRFLASHRPLFYTRWGWHFDKGTVLSMSFSGGGYGRTFLGLEVAQNFNNKVIMVLGSNNLEGYINPDKTTGLGAYLRILKLF